VIYCKSLKQKGLLMSHDLRGHSKAEVLVEMIKQKPPRDSLHFLDYVSELEDNPLIRLNDVEAICIHFNDGSIAEIPAKGEPVAKAGQ